TVRIRAGLVVCADRAAVAGDGGARAGRLHRLCRLRDLTQRITLPLGGELAHAVAARMVRRHQAVDVARQLGAAPLVRRLELGRDVGALLAPEVDQAAAEARLLALVARER